MRTRRHKRNGESLLTRAEAALRKAVADAIEAHRISGDPIVVWRDGKVVRIYPENLAVREKPAKYGK